MPAGAALTTPEMKAKLCQYAGQEMTTGAQAKAFADYYVQAHMNAQADGKTYSQISERVHGRLQGRPDRTGHPGPRRPAPGLFMGTTLRGMLLNAYAFATLGTIAMWAAIAAFIGSAVMFVLGALGIRHAHKVEGHHRPRHRADPRNRLTTPAASDTARLRTQCPHGKSPDQHSLAGALVCRATVPRNRNPRVVARAAAISRGRPTSRH